MSIKIQYTYLSGQTWMYRRNYPVDIKPLVGTDALKRSLKTSDPRLARRRVDEVDRSYDQIVSEARSGVTSVSVKEGHSWEKAAMEAAQKLRSAIGSLGHIESASPATRQPLVGDLARDYLRKRSSELRIGGFKSVRYSIGLFSSHFGEQPLSTLTREDGRGVLRYLPQLSTLLGKSPASTGLTLLQSVAFSKSRPKICGRTQKRIWSQVNHFLDWTVYEGELEANPFRTVRFEQKVRPAPYAVPTDQDVLALLKAQDPTLHRLLLFCLLTGMRSGEASGLLRAEIVEKGNLGGFAKVQPNAVRELKTESSEREVPLHPVLQELVTEMPPEGRLFPDLNVNQVTKRFSDLRDRLGIARPGLVFHSTRKWFITQCERTGVPEHFTASLVGHKSARSENQLTYGIYSAGISDEQKRAIVDQLRLPS
jgi:integrase